MEEDDKEYRWESGYEKTWEAIQEDGKGLIHVSIQDIIDKARRKRLAQKTGKVRLGMMRYLFIIIDASECMQLQDMKPTRLHCVIKLMEKFIDQYFYLNPISQLGIIVTRNKRSEIVSELGGNPRKHIEKLRKALDFICSGEPSLQNALETAFLSLKHMPSHGSREILSIFGSLTTCDPTDINLTISTCKSSNIRCSVISLTAEVRIYKELTKVTGGDFNVILDDVHFKEVLSAQLEPPPSATQMEASLIKMGFPCHTGHDSSDPRSGLGLCMCHLENNPPKISLTGFLCPQCNAKYCELPVECQSCGLTLVSAPHLARSYHHLFPLPPFNQINRDSTHKDMNVEEIPHRQCFACMLKLPPETKIFSCPQCHKDYCNECDIFLHETLHSCPGCASIRCLPNTNGHS
ncbi:TFIIH2 [Lepeophtheirus salmonis]|uniref:General transcription factor IIH subunit n=1 Tax=Lepeophtheirus salmonis TaxID=72036 RepID=A0A0K2TRF5_LEPSM|nr:general transcription factor IIH subunit 2-like [Lepeophtheirus salmonis]CAB4062187.1 TFIIH2 [Lepeophtheirus salmonis]CAF2898289.1 TFIIH2 [Lepeophtheirus salmonis]